MYIQIKDKIYMFHNMWYYQILKTFQNKKQGNFIIMHPNEYNWPAGLCRRGGLNVNWLLHTNYPKPRKNIKLHIVTGHGVYKDLIRKNYGVLEENISVTRWPNYWFNTSLRDMYMTQKNNLNPFIKENYNFTKTFLCMNNKPRRHRIKTLDMIHKQNLTNHCYLSVLIVNKEMQKNSKFWKPKIIELSYQPYSGDVVNDYRFNLPLEWYQTPINLVTETEWKPVINNEIYFTEKTAYSICMLKPFLIVGAKQCHRELENLGFKLYNEIFDYEFDNFDELDTRISNILYQLQELSKEDLNKIWEKTRETAYHNFQNLIKIATTTIPSYMFQEEFKDPAFRRAVLPTKLGHEAWYNFDNLELYGTPLDYYL